MTTSQDLTAAATRTVVEGDTLSEVHRDSGSYFAFPKTDIPAGTTMTLTIQPATDGLLRISRLIVPSSFADDFEIIGIEVGRNHQLSGGPIPANIFTERNVACEMKFHDVVLPRMNVTLAVRNIRTYACTFGAFLVGNEYQRPLPPFDVPSAPWRIR